MSALSPPPPSHPSTEFILSEAKGLRAGFEPRIIGFLCYWCSYVAADAAGIARLVHAPNLRIIRMPCTGMVDPTYVLKALRAGADGVLIAGCHPGVCHYNAGNLKAQRRFPVLKKLLAQFGIEDERVRLEWIAAAESGELVQVVNEMSETLQRLGPFDLSINLAGRAPTPGVRAQDRPLHPEKGAL